MELVRVREDRLRRTPAGQVLAPLAGSGAPFAYELRRDGWRYYANESDALLTVLIPDYPPLTDTSSAAGPDGDGRGPQRLALRSRHARATRTWLQAEYVVDAERRAGPLDASVREVLLSSGTAPLHLDAPWAHEVPLVVVDLAFTPHASQPAPLGNLLWLRPATADGYLRSLAHTGAIALSVRP